MKPNLTENLRLIAFFMFASLAFLCLTSGVTAQNRRASHGESCNRTTRCDSRASLTCKNGVCSCLMTDTMSYDARYQRCSVLAGEKCIFTAVESESSRIDERSWREEMPCTNNAQCQDGFCTCFSGFFETSNGTCEIKRGHREDCETLSACRDDQFLICTEGQVCDCNNTISTFDFARQVCVRKAGAPCQDMSLCVSHSYCRDPRSTVYASGVICACEDGFFANAEGACERKRGYGEDCQNNDYCNNDDYIRLVCNPDGRCGCDGNVSIFDSASNMCRRRAGALCHNFPYCVENSECGRSRYYDREVDVVCECNSRYFEVNGTCELQRGYGGECQKTENCERGLECNLENGLCQCDTSKSVYDRFKGKCVGLANSPCEDTQSCITNSECSWSSGSGDGESRKCICRAGYAPSSNGTCLASYDMWCSEHWTYACNTEQGLICKEGKCACKYELFQTFDNEVQKCVSGASGPCDKNVPCVANSHCGDDKREVLKRCRCNDGFVEVDGDCQLTIGQRCNYTKMESQDIRVKIKCDSYAPLYCIEGVCQCDALQTYDRDVLKCKIEVGGICSRKDTSNLACVEGARCDSQRFVNYPTNGICKCKMGWLSNGNGHCVKLNSTLMQDEEIFGEGW